MRRTGRLGLVLLAVVALAPLLTLLPPRPSVLAQAGPAGAVPPRSEKISSALDQLLRASASASPDQLGTQSAGGDLVVTVEAFAGQGAAAAAAVAGAGGRVRAVYRELIDAALPAGAVAAVAAERSVRRIDRPLPPAAAVVDQGVGTIGAADWAASGLDGAGVAVAIVDLGFEGYRLRLGGDLPAAVRTDCSPEPLENGQPHGTAVAEIVHSVAPAAELYLVNAQTPAEIGGAIACLASHGVSVVNHSVGWAYAGPGDGTAAYVDAIVEDAVGRGILWVNSSGNQAQRHWGGAWNDPNGNGWLNFPDGRERLPVRVDAGGTLHAFLRWDDPWSGACDDYNLYLYDAAGRVGAFSENLQTCSPSGVPAEALSYTASASGSYFLAVSRSAAAASRHLDLITFDQDLPLDDQVPANSLLHPADSASPGMLSVGAVAWSSPDQLEPYSSQGPTSDGRLKPDLVGPDQVASAVLGTFAGTSASAPHVAGAAALLKQASPALAAADLASALRARAVDLGPSGPDPRFGAGRLDLGPPPPAPTPTPTLAPTSPPAPSGPPSAPPPPAPATATARPSATATPLPTATALPSPTATRIPSSPTETPSATPERGSANRVKLFVPLGPG